MMPSPRNDLVAVLNSLAAGKDLAWQGNACRCPFCSDKSRSAGIYDRDGKWRFKCQQCGQGPSDMTDLLCARDRLTYAEVVGQRDHDSLPRSEGGPDIPMRPSGGADATRSLWSLHKIKNKFSPTHIHLYGRPTSHAVVRYVDVTTGKKSFVQIRKVLGLNGSEECWEMGGIEKPWCLYNSWNLTDAVISVFVVEGEKCADRVTQAGHFAVTSMGGAGNAKSSDWSCLSGRSVYVWRDNDAAGEGYASDVLSILRDMKCVVYLVHPEWLELGDKGDVVDYLDRFSPSLWHQELSAVKAGTSLVDCGPKANFVKRLRSIKSGELVSVPLPFPQLDDCCVPLLPGQLTCLCASPGKGKSLFLLQSMIHWHSLGYKFACFMLEQSEEYHVGRLCAQLHGDANLNSLKWISQSAENADHAVACAESVGVQLNEIGSAITVPSGSICHSDVMSWVTAKAESGVRVMAIDPITAVDPVKNIWEADRELVFGIKKLCDKHGCSVIFVTHPRGGSSSLLNADSMAGGQAYGRFSQCVLWITFAKKPKNEVCRTPCGSVSVPVNAIVHVVKASNGPGSRHGIGFNWVGHKLQWSEQGELV